MEKTFNEMRAELVALIKENGTEEQVAFIDEVLKKAKKGKKVSKDSQLTRFRKAILERCELNEFEIYVQFNRGGRHEAMTLCRQLHTRVPEGEEPIWAQDAEGEAVNPLTGEMEPCTVYKIIGIGAEMPEDYKVRRRRKVAEPEEAEEPSEDFSKEIEDGLDIH